MRKRAANVTLISGCCRQVQVRTVAGKSGCRPQEAKSGKSQERSDANVSGGRSDAAMQLREAGLP
jgi:hypothetical protein